MKYKFIGWCREGNSDKVWALIQISDTQYVTIWGRRGKKLQHKVIFELDVYLLTESKLNKGYREISESELDRVYPEFKTDIERTAFWAILAA